MSIKNRIKRLESFISDTDCPGCFYFDDGTWRGRILDDDGKLWGYELGMCPRGFKRCISDFVLSTNFDDEENSLYDLGQ